MQLHAFYLELSEHSAYFADAAVLWILGQSVPGTTFLYTLLLLGCSVVGPTSTHVLTTISEQYVKLRRK